MTVKEPFIPKEYFDVLKKMRDELDKSLFSDYDIARGATSGRAIMMKGRQMGLSKNAFKAMVDQLKAIRSGHVKLDPDMITTSTVELDADLYNPGFFQPETGEHLGGTQEEIFIRMMGKDVDDEECIARSMKILYGKNDGNSDE